MNDALLRMLKRIDHKRVKENQSFDLHLRVDQRRKIRFERIEKVANLTQQDPRKYGTGIAA